LNQISEPFSAEFRKFIILLARNTQKTTQSIHILSITLEIVSIGCPSSKIEKGTNKGTPK
jgi:hypothetical protein